MSTFDITFDQTFGIRVVPSSPVIDACRKPGAYLTWLTLDGGYMYWLFEGKITKEKAVTVKGTRVTTGVTVANQKQSGEVLTVRAGNLTESEARIVSTIYESVDVQLVVTDSTTNAVRQTPVYIDGGNFQTWQTGQSRGVLSVSLLLPTRNSQRS